MILRKVFLAVAFASGAIAASAVIARTAPDAAPPDPVPSRCVHCDLEALDVRLLYQDIQTLQARYQRADFRAKTLRAKEASGRTLSDSEALELGAAEKLAYDRVTQNIDRSQTGLDRQISDKMAEYVRMLVALRGCNGTCTAPRQATEPAKPKSEFDESSYGQSGDQRIGQPDSGPDVCIGDVGGGGERQSRCGSGGPGDPDRVQRRLDIPVVPQTPPFPGPSGRF